jgi:beta-1,4-mannosyl-glycoprotein beta-1,4-N-acetylglucosaminyltransferase
MVLIDAFMFFNELDVLEKRIRYLYDTVDFFIIVESPETHMGNPKPLYFEENKDRYKQWLPKIKHIISDTCPEPYRSEYFGIEKFQRHEILKGLRDAKDTDIILISDADEIPDKSLIDKVHPTCSLHMTMFEYSFDYMFDGEPWVGTVLTSVGDVKRYGPNYFRYNRWRFPITKDAGWHLSSFGDDKHLKNKIENYAHAPDEKHKGQTIDDFKKYINEGIHADGKTKLIKTPLEVKLTLSHLL